MRRPSQLLLTLAVGLTAWPAAAHVAQQGFVLLLPTDVYITSGIWVVALTAVALAVTPGHIGEKIFASLRLPRLPMPHWEATTSCLAFLVLCWLLYVGLAGSRDPLANPLPLFIWTVFWVILVILQALVGDLWRWINPWSGPARLVLGPSDRTAPLRLPEGLGTWPAIITILAFSAFALADPAPDDPARLAVFVALYWLYGFAGMALFGDDWLKRGEFISLLMHHFATLSPIRFDRDESRAGLFGWQLLKLEPLTVSGGIFVLIILGTGSFDGLNETFWWLALIDINPLAFPGRSAIITETVGGLLIANVLLVAAFAALVWLGDILARQFGGPFEPPGYATAFGLLALSILPIALGYHIAHYLTVFLVNGQYALAAASDPFATGADYLGLGTYYVTTGFFNTQDTVRVIFLTQAGAVVIGHVLAILAAHAMALRLYGENRPALLSQIPLAGFMILYTFLGLWLLAAPKGA